MITTHNIREFLRPMYNWWYHNVGGSNHPEHIYYFRDGVSEGQYMHVLEQEVKDMKKILAETYSENIMVYSYIFREGKLLKRSSEQLNLQSLLPPNVIISV